MLKRIYIINRHNPDWRTGQYFIVDEDREYAIPARPVYTGDPRRTRVEATGKIEIPFAPIERFAIEVAHSYEADPQ